MRNHIVFFSGGKASFTVAHLVKERYPDDNILLYFTDTKWEDEDLYRFIHEASDKLELTLLKHAHGVNPMELMYEQKVVYNSRIGNCSKILKMKVSDDYLRKGKEPKEVEWYNEQHLKSDNYRDNPTLYFGIGWEESHRVGAIRNNWEPFKVEMPLVDEVINNDEILELYNIQQPRLYDLGFTHNNCKGRCVKAGQGHFKNLKEKLPDTFDELRKQEFYMQRYVSYYHEIKGFDFLDDDEKTIYLDALDKSYKPYFDGKIDKPKTFVLPGMRMQKYSFMKKQTDGEVNPYTIRDLNIDIEENGHQLDMFDVGGCGCFFDYD